MVLLIDLSLVSMDLGARSIMIGKASYANITETPPRCRSETTLSSQNHSLDRQQSQLIKLHRFSLEEHVHVTGINRFFSTSSTHA